MINGVCASAGVRISELVNGRQPITADTALRLGLFLAMELRFRLNLQAEYDMRTAERELRAKIAHQTPRRSRP
jgi:addiction module HigA family antidote